jgi:hypothetical protein
MAPMKVIAATTLLSLQALYATPSLEDHEKAVTNPDYFIHVILSGVVKDMIFPGPPNFVSVEEGDWAEPRWILDIDGESLVRLVQAQAGATAGHYMGDFIDSELRVEEPNANLVTLDSSFREESESIARYKNKRITIDAVLSAQPAHCHTPFVVEIAEVLVHE